jgi:hypothetical protein
MMGDIADGTPSPMLIERRRRNVLIGTLMAGM